jgi:hypothetical protein
MPDRFGRQRDADEVTESPWLYSRARDALRRIEMCAQRHIRYLAGRFGMASASAFTALYRQECGQNMVTVGKKA